MRIDELALVAHEAIHSGRTELVLPQTSWRIRIAPRSGVRCVAVHSGSMRFYFQAHDPWAGDDDFSILARLGNQVTWVIHRDGEQEQKSVVVNGYYFEDPHAIEEIDLAGVEELVT